MKYRYLALAAAVSLAVAASAAVVVAQDPPGLPAMVLVAESHVKPGMNAQFEEFQAKALVYRTENDFPFQTRTFISDQGVFRRDTVLEGWEDLARREAWFQRVPPPEYVNEAWEAREYVNTSIWRPRPELSYRAANSRIPRGERGFLRERRVYLRQGVNAEAEEINRQMVALYEQHGIGDDRLVFTQLTGAEGPAISILLPARDREDFFAEIAGTTETLGDEIRELRQQLARLTRKAEWISWTIRRDLDDRPAGQ